MRTLGLVTALSLSAVFLAGCGLKRALESTVSQALTAIEADPRERALLIAAGAGRVSTVRALLADGVRPDPDTVAAAAVGVFEPIYSWSGCDRHAEVTRLLLESNPRLRLRNTPVAHVVRLAASVRCREVQRVLAN